METGLKQPTRTPASFQDVSIVGTHPIDTDGGLGITFESSSKEKIRLKINARSLTFLKNRLDELLA